MKWLRAILRVVCVISLVSCCVAVVFEVTSYIIKLYHHRQHKKYIVRDSIEKGNKRMNDRKCSLQMCESSRGISSYFGINGSRTDGRFLWSFRFNSKFPGAAGDHRKHLAAIRLSSQNRGQQIKPPSLQDHHRRSRYQPQSFANVGELEGPRLGRDWWKKFSSPGRNWAHGGR